MGFVALKPIEMGDHVRRPGEMIPEAAKWPHLNAWVKRGFVTFVAEGHEATFVQELRAGNIRLELAPVAKPHHLSAAARLLSYGTAPETTPANSPPASDVVPPTEPGAEADAAAQEPLDAPAVAAPAKRKKA